MMKIPELLHEVDTPPVGIRGSLLRKHEMAFVRRAVEVVQGHIADPEFDTITLSHELGYSRMHVNRRLQATIGCSTRAFIRFLRMRCARRLLEHEDLTVSCVARSVGFRSLSHFSHVFKSIWGVSPTHFRRDEPAPIN